MIKAYQNYQQKIISVLLQFFKRLFFEKSVVACFYLPWFQYAFALIGVDDKLTKAGEDVIE